MIDQNRQERGIQPCSIPLPPFYPAAVEPLSPQRSLPWPGS
jgi:hypothetical protein